MMLKLKHILGIGDEVENQAQNLSVSLAASEFSPIVLSALQTIRHE